MSKLLGAAVCQDVQGEVLTAGKKPTPKDDLRCSNRVDPDEFNHTLPTLYSKGELVDMFAKTVEVSAAKVAKKEEQMTAILRENENGLALCTVWIAL
jgi:hypothetical protein